MQQRHPFANCLANRPAGKAVWSAARYRHAREAKQLGGYIRERREKNKNLSAASKNVSKPRQRAKEHKIQELHRLDTILRDL